MTHGSPKGTSQHARVTIVIAVTPFIAGMSLILSSGSRCSLTVTSGEIAYVFTGEVIPYQEQWNRVTKVES